jgi:ketosteroid isomerase-like protein
MTTNDQIRHVYETWHRAIVGRDLDKLMALYANENVLDSSAVLVLEKDPSGIIRGRDRIRKHFASFFCDARREQRQGTGTARNNSFGTVSRWSGNTRARGPMETSSTSLSRWIWKTAKSSITTADSRT